MVLDNHDANLPDERFTGEDAFVKIGGREFAVSNVSWDVDTETTEVQHNDDFRATVAITGLRYSGSFEYEGKNEDLRSLLYDDNGIPVRFTITVRETSGGSGNDPDVTTTETEIPRTWTFSNAMTTGLSRDVPSDDVGSTTVDFVAEQVTVDQ